MPLSIDELSNEVNKVLIYPNPGRGEFNFLFSGMRTKERLMTIYSITGVLIDEIKIPSGVDAIKWNSPSSLPSGMYFIKVIDGDETYSERFIVE